MSENHYHFRTRAVAHLYVAVAKVDGILSSQERLRAPYLARKSQKVLALSSGDRHVEEALKQTVLELLQDEHFRTWEADQHLQEARSLLQRALQSGDWSSRLTAERHEEGLYNLAKMDGYTFRESRFLSHIKEVLRTRVPTE